MHSLPSIALLQQEHAVPKSGEELEVLGKSAARRYANGQSQTLNDSVVETVKHAGLSPEQVRRVVEFANVNAYLSEFNKEGDAHKYVEFHGGPASPGEVLRDLNDGGGGTVFDRGLSDYVLEPTKLAEVEPSMEKAASAVSLDDIARDMGRGASRSNGLGQAGMFDESQARRRIAELSAISGRQPVVVKHASLDFDPVETAFKEAFAAEDLPFPYHDPYRDAVDLKDKLAGVAEHLTSDLSSLEAAFFDVLENLYQEVKHASLEGASLGQVISLCQPAIPDAAYLKVAFSHIGPRLVEDEVLPNLDAVGASLAKTASTGLPNHNHPLVNTMGAFCEILHKLAETRAARDELSVERDRLDWFLKEAVSAVDVAGAVGRGAQRTTQAVGDVTGSLLSGIATGAGAPKSVSKAIKSVGHIGGALALPAAATYGGVKAVQKAKEWNQRRVAIKEMKKMHKLQRRLGGAGGMY